MILVDTSVWIEHFRLGNNGLTKLLDNTQVLMHPFVIGELACGNLNQRRKILNGLNWLPQANMASDSEVLYFIESQKLMGQGIGYIDTHLLASVTLTHAAGIWTRDKRLEMVAFDMNLGWQPG